MTSDEQPTQPLTERLLNYFDEREMDCLPPVILDLVAELDRLRSENAAVKTKCDGFQKMMNSAVSAGVTIDGERLDVLREVEQLRAESTGTALGHLTTIERLQSQRDALVRKLGLDWGPDEFGDLSVVPDVEKPCLDSPDWSCRLGPRCVCSKYEHDTRHECACGSWWYTND